MSALIFWGLVATYVVFGVGTARTIAARARKFMNRQNGMEVSAYWNFGDPEITMPTVFGGLFWPIAWVWLLLLGPIVTVVGPLFAAWWLKPYRRAGGEL